MSVIIENMEIPKTCDDCLSGFRKTIGCKKAMFFNGRDVERHPDCPIKEFNKVKKELEE